MNRREFVWAATLAGAGTSALGSRALASERRPALQGTDVHAHVTSARLAGAVNGVMGESVLAPKSAESLVETLNQNGHRRALVLSAAYLWAADALPEPLPGTDAAAGQVERVRAENDLTAQECAYAPDRLIPFASVNPKRDWAVDEIDRCVEDLGMRGVKLHFWNSDVDVRQPDHVRRVRRVFARADSLRLPVLVHFFNGGRGYGPEHVKIFHRQILSDFPTLRICLAHMCGAGSYGGPQSLLCDAFLESFESEGGLPNPRAFVDIAAVLFEDEARGILPPRPPMLERLGEQIQRWGIGNVLWGTDNVPRALGQARGLWPLSQSEWERVVSNDARAFLGDRP